MATIGELLIEIGATLKPLEKKLTSAEAKMRKSGRKLASIGRELSTNISVPIIAAGGAAIKLATDFQDSMTKIQSQVGIAASEVKGMQKDVLRLAGNTARAPKELADALFFITSAGLRGKEAIEALEFSAKAAATGFGETKVIADLLTSAMNAYGSEVLSAEMATDVLAATVREGKADATELAAAMGKVLPIASNMSVQFREVGGAIAAMTRTGTNAAEATTQLNAIMMTFMKPSAEAAKIVKEELNTSFAELREEIKEKGLLSVITDMTTKLKEQGIQTAEVFREGRALKGVLDLTGASLKENTALMGRMADTTGAAQAAFEIASQTAKFKFNQALVQLRASTILLGTTLLPIAAEVAEKISKAAQAFAGLSEGTQKTILKVAAFAAAIGPAIFIVGKLKLAFAAVLTTIKAVFSASTLVSLLNPWGLAIAGIIALGVLVVKNWDVVKKAVINVANSFVDVYNAVLPVRFIIESLKFTFQTLWKAVKIVFGNILKGFNTIFRAFNQAVSGDLPGAMETIKNAFRSGFAEIKDFGKDTGERFSKGLEEVLKGRMSYIGLDSFAVLENIAKNSSGNIKAIMDGIISDITPDIPSGGGGRGGERSADSAGIQEGVGAIATSVQGIQIATDQVGQAYNAFASGVINTSPMISEAISAINLEPLSKMEQIMARIKGIGIEMGKQVSSSLQRLAQSGSASFRQLGKSALAAAADVVRSNILKGVTSILEGTLSRLSFLGPFAIPIAGVAAAAAATLFNKVISGIGIPRFAAGVDSAPGGLALVGERGPELIDLPQGSRVYPNHAVNSFRGGGELSARLEIDGDKLVVLIDEINRRRTRLGI